MLRLPAVYGPGDAFHRLHEYLKRMDEGRPAILVEAQQAEWRWTRGYVENVAAAIVLAVTDARAARRTYNVGEPDALSEVEWIRQIGRAAGWEGEILPVPSDRLPAHLAGEDFDWRHHLVTDTSRLRDELGYAEPLSREGGLQRAVEW
ncbi:MAG TPA: NAD-dependent epimerase/dehydratase family protein, partial [Longimicrobiaceae bacterium]|nr:NAD-dependent epimerase/dehydratase family protein [Longimicrobiaceae bacterium]